MPERSTPRSRKGRSRAVEKSRQNPGISATVPPAQEPARGRVRLPGAPPAGIGLLSVGRFLRSMREALGLTQDEIAAKTNGLPWPVSRAAVSALEKGKHAPAATTILALCEVLRIDATEVMDRLKLAAAPRRPIDNRDYAQLRLWFEGFFSTGDFRQALTVLDAMAMAAAKDRAVTPSERSRRLVAVDISRATTLKRLGAITASRSSAERALERSAEFQDLQANAYVALSEA